MKIICKKNEQIILELGSTVVTAYLAKEGKLVQFARPAANTQAEVLAAIFANELSIQKKAELVLLSADCFSQMVALTAAQQQGLSPQELRGVLAYEVEPFSGIVPQSAVLAYASSGAEFSVLEIEASEFNNLVQVARANSVELKAILHAGNQFIEESEEQKEARLKKIVATGLEQLAKSEPVIVVKDITSANTGFLELSPEAFKRLVLRVAIAVAILCGLHYLLMDKVVLEEKQSEVAKLEEPVAKINNARNSLSKLNREIKKLKENGADTGDNSTKLAARHFAWNAMFTIVGSSCGDFAFVKGIESPASNDVCIKLFSVHKDAELRFYEMLTKNKLCMNGWEIITQKLRAMSQNEFHVYLSYNEANAVNAYLASQANSKEGK